MQNPLRLGLLKHFSPAQLSLLASARVGIAGAGGLGSNTAMLLARSGVERMLIIDHDVVDATNLNRQHYWPRHLGRKKIDALAEILLELNPGMRLRLLDVSLDRKNLPPLLGECQIWVEALDAAPAKSMFVDEALKTCAHVVSATGLCGFGGAPLAAKRLGRLTLAGDFVTGSDQAPPLAPRVTQAAAIMADSVVTFILGHNAANTQKERT